MGDGCEFPMGRKVKGLAEPVQDGLVTESDEELYNAHLRESSPLTMPQNI